MNSTFRNGERIAYHSHDPLPKVHLPGTSMRHTTVTIRTPSRLQQDLAKQRLQSLFA